MYLTIIIVNWNARAHLARCLPALAEVLGSLDDILAPGGLVVVDGSLPGPDANPGYSTIAGISNVKMLEDTVKGAAAVVAAVPERRGGRQRQKVRQEIGHLSHQIRPQRIVSQADMHMHPADQHPPRHG